MAPDAASSPSGVRAVDRLPPYSEEAEKGVLGSILLDPDVMDVCIEHGLVEESFYVPAHRLIFGQMLAMHDQTVALDALTVGERLRTTNRLEQIGGAVFLDRLIDATPTAAHAGHYVDIVRQKHLLRSIIDCAREAERNCYETDESADHLLGRAEQAFLDITERQHGFILPWREAIRNTMRMVDGIFGGAKSPGGIPTGFLNIDRVAHGLRPGEMIVLAARPSMGKTSLAMNIAEHVALGKGKDCEPVPVGIFSLEMSQESLAMRILCGQAEVSSEVLLRGFVPAPAHARLVQAASALSGAPLFVDDSAGLDVLELRARARRMKKKYGIGLIVIDYLQLLQSREYARQGRQNETANISSQLKALAKELKVPVLVLSQLSRAPEQRDKQGKPKLSDLRDSGAIEQDADMVWLLRRPCRNPDDAQVGDKTLAILDVAKHRNGRTGEVEMNFIEEFTRFQDRAHGVDDPPAVEARPPPQQGRFNENPA